MDLATLRENIPKWIRRYRYPLIVALAGVLILLLPSLKRTEQKTQTVATVQSEKQTDSEQLAQILGQIKGVGKVKVMLAVDAGETTIYHSDEDSTVSDTSTTVRKETVIVTDSERNQKPLITQVIPQTYRGAVIVCQGADDPAVKWAVVEAVSKATGLGANQISVLKMK